MWLLSGDPTEDPNQNTFFCVFRPPAAVPAFVRPDLPVGEGTAGKR